MPTAKNRLYQKILNEPDGLEALYNSFILPESWMPYSAALLEIEKQKFQNFLCEPSRQEFRNRVDFERVCLSPHYLERCKLDKRLKRAEEQRLSARVCLNDAIISGFIKSRLYVFDKAGKIDLENPEELSKDWWRSAHAFSIDGFSLFFRDDGEKIISEGAIGLERKSLEKWGAAFPNQPKTSGRKKGSGGLDDQKSLEFMHILVSDGVPILRAAQLAVEEYGVKGASEHAAITRLRTKYSTEYI